MMYVGMRKKTCRKFVDEKIKSVGRRTLIFVATVAGTYIRMKNIFMGV